MTEQRRHDRYRIALIAFAAAVLVAAVAGTASAQDTRSQDTRGENASWYVVGDIDHRGTVSIAPTADFSDRMVTGHAEERVALGLTLTNAAAGRPLGIAPSAPATDGIEDRFTFLVSGAYDWHTGTIVTPRFMAGVGLSYLDIERSDGRPRSAISPGGDIAPAVQLGIGADVAITGSLDLSAEYRAFYRGATDLGGTERDPQIDQKFMLGAKIRF